QSPREAMGDQAGDGGAAGLVGAEDLAEGDPQGHQRRVDAVEPAGPERRQRARDEALREDVGEREPSILEELVPQEARLPAKGRLVGAVHCGGLRAGEGTLAESLLRERGHLAHLLLLKGLVEIKATFVRDAGATSGSDAGKRTCSGK